jgi:hypothetical protein
MVSGRVPAAGNVSLPTNPPCRMDHPGTGVYRLYFGPGVIVLDANATCDATTGIPQIRGVAEATPNTWVFYTAVSGSLTDNGFAFQANVRVRP